MPSQSSQIDYEYPATPLEAKGFSRLLQDLRRALKELALSKGKPESQYLLTVAAPGGYTNMRVLDIAGMDRVSRRLLDL